ncbi:GntR family transcriptional regulator [Treponema primitia]|uniref:GntR family transcriptional regulator n=1 Tax=Treponema primitia TaxID=88058 RepID=UPI00397FF7DC
MSLKLQAYTTIKEKILSCEYPPNILLKEERLCEDIQASRTPIRDALSRLEQESLIQILPKRGIIVAGISLEEVEQIYELRLLIEPYALERYGETIDQGVYKKLKDFFTRSSKKFSLDEIHKKDDEFHHMFISAAKNAYLTQAYQYPYIQNIRLRILSGTLGTPRIEKSQKEHCEITQYCLEKSWKKAAKALRVHLLHSKEISYSIITKLQLLLNR